MNEMKFKELVYEIIKELEHLAQKNKELFLNASPDDFEEIVKDTAENIQFEKKMKIKIQYEKGSHIFPDIIFQYENGEKFGIEVKSSRSKIWKINGNSILGTTKDKDVKLIFIIFGQLTDSPSFKCREYEACISDIVVTHSPRYKIDMLLDSEQNFFHYLGVSYEELNSSEDPIGLVTEKFREKGKTAWWIAESAPASIEMLGDLDIVSRSRLLAECFIRFPEIFSKHNPLKYSRSSKWLIATHSVIAPNLRDYFSASGQINIVVNNNIYKNMPQIFNKIKIYKPYILEIISDIPEAELVETWHLTSNVPSDTNHKITVWISVIQNLLCGEYSNIFDIQEFLTALFIKV